MGTGATVCLIFIFVIMLLISIFVILSTVIEWKEYKEGAKQENDFFEAVNKDMERLHKIENDSEDFSK